MWINWNVFEEFWVWICLLSWSHCPQSIQEIVLLHLSPTTYFVGMRTSIMVFKWCNESPFRHHRMSYCETMRRGVMWKWQMFVKWNFLQCVCIEKLFCIFIFRMRISPKVAQFYLAILPTSTFAGWTDIIQNDPYHLTHFSHRHWHYGLSKLIVYSQIKVIIETAWFFVLACLNQREKCARKR